MLVSNHENHDVWVTLVLDLLQPRLKILEGLTIVDGVAKKNRVRCPVEDLCDRAERLLACRVPDLQLEESVLDFDAARSEVDADSDVVFSIEDVLGEPCQDAGLAHA